MLYHTAEAEKVAFSHYMYHITASPGSGEYALRHLLEPFAWAKDPIGPRVSQLKASASRLRASQAAMIPRRDSA